MGAAALGWPGALHGLFAADRRLVRAGALTVLVGSGLLVYGGVFAVGAATVESVNFARRAAGR